MGSYTPKNAIDLCIKWEGFYKLGYENRAFPYLCPAGVWTIGYGTTRFSNGTRVTKDTLPITRDEAEGFLLSDLERAVAQTLTISPTLISYEEKLGAISSFVYNLGASRYKASTLRSKVNSDDWVSAKQEIKKWVWGGGRRLPGLILRRNDEATYL